MIGLALSLDDAMRDACREVGIHPPARIAYGEWLYCRVEGKPAGNTSGRVKLWTDGQGGHAINHTTGQSIDFRIGGDANARTAPRPVIDPDIERERERKRRAVAEVCERIVRACTPAEHPYLARKGFPRELGLVIERDALLAVRGMTDAMRHALPEGDGPLLVIPGRIGRVLTTVQFIPAEAKLKKKNIRGSAMGGACHRIASGAQTWVCEGIATALSVKAALKRLNVSATVLSAFSASNAAEVARAHPGCVVAADNDSDKPQPHLGGLGTGEFWARRSGRRWTMPPSPGDWNDMHMAEGLRAVCVALRDTVREPEPQEDAPP